ncbi:hypothetical protein MMC13_001782 [Lambiella insularis]|nr:hypothetical protein [Lambiella insularis]
MKHANSSKLVGHIPTAKMIDSVYLPLALKAVLILLVCLVGFEDYLFDVADVEADDVGAAVEMRDQQTQTNE